MACINTFPEKEFKFGDTAASQVVEFSLPRKPTAAVGVFVASPALTSNKCMLKFTPDNWNVKQKLVVAPSAFLSDAEKARALILDIALSSRDPSYHRKTHQYPFIRSQDHGGVCTAAGDPHFRTFNGRTFDYQGQGCFYLVKSKYLSVLGSFRCPGFNRGVTIATSIAVRYGSARWMIGINSGEKVASDNLDGIVIARSGNTIELRCNDGAVIRITKNFWTQGEWYLDTQITLPLHYKNRVHGLCGNINDNNLYKCSDTFPGPITNNPNEFGDSYAVPNHDNIFVCSARKANGKYGSCTGDVDLKVKGKFRTCSIPFIPPLDKYKDPREDEGYGAGGGYVIDEKLPPGYGGEQNIPFQPVTEDALESISPICEVQATAICEQTIKDPTCEKFLKAEHFVKNCVFDCCAIRREYTESWKRQYYAYLYDLSRSFLNDRGVDRKIRLDIARVTLKYGLNGRKTECKNKGTQTAIGCCCPPPYTGCGCEFDYSKMQERR